MFVVVERFDHVDLVHREVEERTTLACSDSPGSAHNNEAQREREPSLKFFFIFLGSPSTDAANASFVTPNTFWRSRLNSAGRNVLKT